MHVGVRARLSLVNVAYVSSVVVVLKLLSALRAVACGTQWRAKGSLLLGGVATRSDRQTFGGAHLWMAPSVVVCRCSCWLSTEGSGIAVGSGWPRHS